MRKTAAIPALALLLVTGCSAANAEPEATPSAAPATTPAAVETLTDTEEQTCLKLLGTDGSGPLSEVTHLVRIEDGLSGFDGSAETARLLNGTVGSITRAASEDMEPLLKELSSPLENTILIAENPGRPWMFNPETFTSAVAELETRCEPYAAGS